MQFLPLQFLPLRYRNMHRTIICVLYPLKCGRTLSLTEKSKAATEIVCVLYNETKEKSEGAYAREAQ